MDIDGIISKTSFATPWLNGGIITEILRTNGCNIYGVNVARGRVQSWWWRTRSTASVDSQNNYEQ